MERREEKYPTAGDISPQRIGSDASTFPNSPSSERHSASSRDMSSAEAQGAANRNSTRPEKPAWSERRRAYEAPKGLRVASLSTRMALLEPSVVMKVSALTATSGSVCLLLMVFSGTILVCIAVVTLGICGMCYSIRQRGALKCLPRGIVELLTRTTLLEFLTDTSVFDAIKTYLVFMMGLSKEETERVLHSLPEDMQQMLTRPGLMHTLPRPLQGLLLPLGESALAGALMVAAPSTVGDGRGSDRLGAEGSENLLGGRSGRVASREADPDRDDEERASPLGQLVWNPLPLLDAPETLPLHESDAARDARQMLSTQGVGVGEGNDPDADDTFAVDRADEEGEEGNPDGKENRDEAEEGKEPRAAVRDRDGVDDEVGHNGGVGGSDRCQPWAGSPLHSSRSLSPQNDRPDESARASTEANRAHVSAQHHSRGASSASPDSRVMCGKADNPGGNVDGSSARRGPIGVGLMPSAERIVASILQSRVDKALRSAWNLVDERRVRQAALGSGVALAAHVAFSERARRQATSMLRGGMLAGLAGTATVCAALAYLKQGGASLASADENHRDGDTVDRDHSATAAAVSDREEEHAGDSVARRSEGGGNRTPSRLYRLLIAMKPSTRSLVRLLGMICILLAIRKWQLLRRLTIRTIRPSGLYGMSPR